MQRRRFAAVHIADQAAAPSPSGAQSSARLGRGPDQGCRYDLRQRPVPAESGVCAATMNGAVQPQLRRVE